MAAVPSEIKPPISRNVYNSAEMTMMQLCGLLDKMMTVIDQERNWYHLTRQTIHLRFISPNISRLNAISSNATSTMIIATNSLFNLKLAFSFRCHFDLVPFQATQIQLIIFRRKILQKENQSLNMQTFFSMIVQLAVNMLTFENFLNPKMFHCTHKMQF